MTDLDEAIFPVEGVMDFGASLDREMGIDRLRIEARTAPPANRQTIDAIREALSVVPVIRYALQKGALALDVSLLPEGQTVKRNTAKRVLLDLRD